MPLLRSGLLSLPCTAYFGKRTSTLRNQLILPIDIDDDGRVSLRQVPHLAAEAGLTTTVSTELADLVDALAIPYEIGFARDAREGAPCGSRV
jgi:hypothetical protein